MSQQTRAQARALITFGGDLVKFMPRAQLSALQFALVGEEADGMALHLIELAAKLYSAPKTYEQDGKGMGAIAHAHYFYGGMNFYITEFDVDGMVDQAYGWADLGDGGELGYISIRELVQNAIELDLHWTPKPLKECIKNG